VSSKNCKKRILRFIFNGRSKINSNFSQNIARVSFYYFNQNRELDVPVTCKIRIFPDDEDTIEYVKRLEKSGCKSNLFHF
jgi:hypothetical protein